MTEANADIDDIAKEIKKSSYTTVLTGAGISAESGIPTFAERMDFGTNTDLRSLQRLRLSRRIRSLFGSGMHGG